MVNSFIKQIPPKGEPLVQIQIGNEMYFGYMYGQWYPYFGNFSNTALVQPGSAGILSSDGSVLYANTLTAGSNKISITNATGGASNPTIDVNQDNLSIATSQITGSFVASVGLSMPAEFSVSGSPITSSGTLTVTKANQSANQVWAGPTTGAAAAPAFRALVGADLPNPGASSLGGVKSNAGSSNSFVYSLDTSGNLLLTQPQFSGIGGTISHTQLSTTVTAGSFTTGAAGIPSFSAYNSSITTCAASAFTKIAFQTKEFDIGSYYDNVTNYRYTPLVAGIYNVSGMVSISSANIVTTQQYNAALYKNGSAFRYGSFNADIAGNATSSFNTYITMNGSTDYLEIYFFNSNAVNPIGTNASQLVTYFSAAWVGPNS